MNERRVLRELVKTKASPTSTSKPRGFAGSLSVSGEELLAYWLATLNGNFNHEEEKKEEEEEEEK